MISGNITATTSDHLTQFSFAPNVLSKASCQKSNTYERDWSKDWTLYLTILIKIGLMFSS